jgi:dephospho-CoA kinase
MSPAPSPASSDAYPRTVLIVGLTGGIGSGKSTVASMLGAHGAHVVDVDALGRAVIAPGGRAESEVLDAFGPGVTTDDGHVDRAALARAVFGRPDELARLTAISHPAINAELAEHLDALPADTIVVLDMAILVESNLGRGDPAHSYSRVVVVEAPVELRVRRAVERGMREDDVRARIASQASDDDRRAVADVVVVNDGDLPQLSDRVDALWVTILGWSVPAND